MQRTFRRSAVLALALAFSASTAHAHGAGVDTLGLSAGLAHPFTGADHLAAMLAVGVLAAQMGGRAIFALPTAFVLAMLAGGATAMTGLDLPWTEAGSALSVALLGGLIAWRARRRFAAAAVLVAGFGLWHGHAHGLEIPADASGLAYASGFVAGTAALHAAGAAGGLTLLRGGDRLRWAGVAVALLGAALFVERVWA